MIDVVHEINAVRRTVGSRTLEAGAGHVVTISRVYDATLEELWDACTSAERIPRWFLPITGELAPGGRYQLEGNAGGTIERCDPPHSFAATWEFGGTVSAIELTLTAETDTTTRFALRHVLPDDDHWAQFGPGATGVGWELGLLGLGMHLRGEPKPPDPAVWMASDEARRLMTLSSERWGDAAAEAGEDPGQARAAAERTTAAYVPVSP